MKKSGKILLYLSVILIVALLFYVFKGVSNFIGHDSAELNNSTKVPKEMSYLKNQEKAYIIKEYSNKKHKVITYIQRYIGESKGYHTWYGTETVVEKENKYGLFFGSDKVLAYPVEKGKTWNVSSFTFTIESVNNTIKTPAGTFKNVVAVKTSEKGVKGYTMSYYAKGVGQILRVSVDENSKKTVRYELQKLTYKSYGQ